MRKILSIVLILGMLVCAGTTIAGDLTLLGPTIKGWQWLEKNRQERIRKQRMAEQQAWNRGQQERRTRTMERQNELYEKELSLRSKKTHPKANDAFSYNVVEVKIPNNPLTYKKQLPSRCYKGIKISELPGYNNYWAKNNAFKIGDVIIVFNTMDRRFIYGQCTMDNVDYMQMFEEGYLANIQTGWKFRVLRFDIGSDGKYKSFNMWEATAKIYNR